MQQIDCINQQARERLCSHCIWHTDGRCASWDCEYISRKEALEALEKVKNATPMVLPPEQPEIVRCKDCKWFGKAGCAIEIVDDSDKPTEDDYCSFAERRTDEKKS